jgi:hypothetical protein
MLKLFAILALLGTLAMSQLADAQIRGIERGGYRECGPVLGQMYIYALPNNTQACTMYYSQTCDGVTLSWTGSCS